MHGSGEAVEAGGGGHPYKLGHCCGLGGPWISLDREQAGVQSCFVWEGRERFNTTGPSLTAHRGFCVWRLESVRAHSEMMLKVGKEGGAGDGNDHTPASQCATWAGLLRVCGNALQMGSDGHFCWHK